MAIFMSPIEHTNLWTGYKIPQGRYIKCGCFIKRDTWSSCDILRPESHRSIHLLGKQSRKILVKDSGIRCQIAHSRRPPAHILGSSRTASWFLLRPFVLAKYRGIPSEVASYKQFLCFYFAEHSSGLTDENKIVQSIRTDSQVSMHSSSNFMCGDKNSSMDANTMLSDAVGPFSIRDHPVEEPWLSSSSTLSHRVAKPEACNDLVDERKLMENLQINFLASNSIDGSTLMSVSSSESENTLYAISKSFDANPKEYHLVEEPWLLEPILLYSDPKANVISSELQNKDYVKDEQAQSAACDQEQKMPKKALAEEERNIISHDPTSTVILINASICTMQRIAVLEDGKLVELLLEPVKNNVQCDSVYLGLITKLVPQMGGAFVNIGGPRSSFMDMKSKREPFIFPPIHCHEKEKELNGSMLGELLGLPGVHEDEHNIEDPDEIEDNEMEDDSIEDVGQHNFDDGSDVTEIFGENVNGSVVSNGMGVDSGRDLDHLHENKQHQKVQNGGKTFSFDIEYDHVSQMSNLQKMEKLKDVCVDESKWFHVQKGTKIIVQVLKEGLGTKGPQLTAYPKLRSRFWVLSTRGNTIGISKKISGVERTRLRVIAKTLQPWGFGLTVRTVAAGQSLEELNKDLEGLLATWKVIVEHAKSAALAADEGVEGAIPVLLHRAMGQTLSVVQDYFNEKVRSMVVDSPRTYYEVTNYLQEIAPDLCGRVELYNKRTPLFDEYNIEEEIDTILSKRVPLANGGYLVIEQTEALVSIDVNGGHCMLGQGTSQEKAILDVNLMAARQIAQELRLRDIGGIIVVDFIDMMDDSNKRLVYEEVKKAVEKDRSTVKVSELSRHGLMEITRKRVRPSVTFMISEPCTCCHATGRVEALETSFSKIEHEICRLLAMMDQRGDPENAKSWPRFILRVDRYMCNYLTSGRRTRLAVLSSSLKVWILLKVARGFSRGAFELKPLAADMEFNNEHQPTISVLQREGGTYTPSKKVTLFPIKKWRTGGK